MSSDRLNFLDYISEREKLDFQSFTELLLTTSWKQQMQVRVKKACQ